ncbi:glutamate--tRNA ligase [Chitinophagales bacterium]|nr:glutamate--tRNA ligase [Chitinophagales bacterium]
MVRTRYAPSPTGFQHMGGIRTALYAYLFAKKNGGTLVLRIEDTDQSRYVEGAEEYIMESLQWTGILADEGPGIGGDYGPYRQSDRKEIYQKYVQQLLDNGKAYYAFDSSEELTAKRDELGKSGRPEPSYSPLFRTEMKNSLSLSAAETKELLDSGADYTVRLKIPADEEVIVQDQIRGTVRFQSNLLDEKVLFKSDGMPTYHLANIVDDHLMKITHVIRGEEWLPSTPLHVLLYQAFGWEDSMPQFAHLPLILKPEGNGKLSKRAADKLGFPVFPLAWQHPTTDESSNGYRELGFLPEAFNNFLAMLGWNPGDEREKFSMAQLIEAFSIERVVKAGARFNFDKAKWFNEEYIKGLSVNELSEIALPSFPAVNGEITTEKLNKTVALYQDKITYPQQIWEQSDYLFNVPTEFDAKTVRTKWKEDNKEKLKGLKDSISALSEFSPEAIETCIKSYIETHELSFGNILLPFRVMLTGVKGGPSIFDIASILGKEETLSRMENAMSVFEEMNAANS